MVVRALAAVPGMSKRQAFEVAQTVLKVADVEKDDGSADGRISFNEYMSLLTGLWLEASGRHHLFGAGHPLRAEINALFGEGGARLRRMVTKWDFNKSADTLRNAALTGRNNSMMWASCAAVLALRFGDIDTAMRDWEQAAGTCAAVVRAIASTLSNPLL